MAEPFIGEIKIISWNFAPQGWAFCNGQLLPINQNQALFSILGTTYGGDGRVNFALPDLRGRTPIYTGQGFTLGQRGGETAHTLILSEMPAHTHFGSCNGTANSANQGGPGGNYWADGGKSIYSNASPNTTMLAGAVAPIGGSQAHENMSPYLVLNFIIALVGIFPSRN
ncbi:MAG TPA: tail fiber protein [Pyrinomonadaceae bacterium]